jgi:hypothetical protein
VDVSSDLDVGISLLKILDCSTIKGKFIELEFNGSQLH